jgi:TonB dependent receptor/Carboxypeptidase regulatory-like domain
MHIGHIVTALVLLVAFVCQETWALAGTTGGLTGSVVEATSSAPIAGAVVTVSSPSQTATVTTDASGHFGFLTLAPDTYTVSVTKDQFQPTTEAGQIVFADSVQTLTVRMQKSLSTIAHVTSTGAGSLVKSGTTSDVYSINAAGQAAASALGGGGSLNSAYSAVASVPGAYVLPNQTGYYQTVHIRGGDYDQVGYEFDGVPVNRSFDNYPSSSASSLGNAEVQVYTGASPANSEGQGLAGYINQVIRTGTYPGFADGQLGIATPAFYHRAEVEAGGSTPDRLFSYYVGVAGYNQSFDFINNQNGSNYDNWMGAPVGYTFNPGQVTPFAPTANIYEQNGPQQAYYYMGPTIYTFLTGLSSRDTVVNLHFAIPHKNNSGRDDVQLLWDSESLHNSFYSSTNDITSTQGCGGATTGAQCSTMINGGVPSYVDGLQFTCQGDVGKTFTAAGLNGLSKCVSAYYFPSSANRTAPGQPVPADAGDATWNNQEIVKLQYTHNMGSNAFLRIYGYSYYSDWLQNAPQSLEADFTACCSPDYELSSHTRGLSAQFQDQINAQNLVSLQEAYVTANSIRDNNSWYAAGPLALIVNPANPTSGYCYGPTGGAPVNCLGALQNNAVTMSQLQSGGAPALPASCPNPGASTSQCAYIVAENGNHATVNQVVPTFWSTSLTDEFRPTDKWLLNVGVRLDSFGFQGSNTSIAQYGTSPAARNLWTNAFNLDNCVNNISGIPSAKAGAVTAACPAGTSPAFFQNIPSQNYVYNIWQPRIGGTYTVNQNTVIRFSYGRYAQASNTAYEQYNVGQEDLADYIGQNFAAFGRTTPGYPVAPATSLNYDISLEQHLKGTDISFKLTPYLRQTQDQIQEFYLDQKTGFVSGLNAGSQRSQGVEFEMTKGDFSKNGFAGQLSFTYTDSYVKYGVLASGAYGTTVITGSNQAISDYNAWTSKCAPGGAWVGKTGYNHVKLCGTATDGAGAPVIAAPCYTTAGAAVTTGCTAADVGNPYWNNPQSQIDPSTEFPTYSLFPGGVGSQAAAFGVPYAASLLLNYKHDRFTITPSLQFEGGGKYGYPQSNPGIDPAACSAILPGVAGYNGGGRYDATKCAVGGNFVAAIPDTYTGNFDGIGAFTQPNLIALNMQLSYEVSPRVTLTGTLANIVNTCWGGSVEPWTVTDGNVCSYAAAGYENGFAGEIEPVGNMYNPAGHNGSVIQPLVKYPYGANFGPASPNNADGAIKTPFQFYVTAKIKL